MKKNPSAPWQLSRPESLAKQFSRLGWIGFYVQVVLLVISIFLLIYVLYISSPESATRKGLDLNNYLSYGSLIFLAFTTYWFYYYTRLSKKIANSDLRPSRYSVERKLWIGLWASALGIVDSMILMMQAVGRLLITMLATPQTGLTISGTGEDPTYTLSAIDAISLMSLQFIVTAELVILGFSIWLLFRVSRQSENIAVATKAV
jgi:hypothetical protein